MTIADAQVYDIAFAKEELQQSDYKITILISLFEIVFKNDNPSYQVHDEDDTLQDTYEKKYGRRRASQESASDQIENKSLEKDMNVFKIALLNHCIDNPPLQLHIFDSWHVKKILSYLNKCYAEKFSLYKYIFQNKKKNEEIKLNVYIDEPLACLPLSDALYMGYDYQFFMDDDEDEKEYVILFLV